MKAIVRQPGLDFAFSGFASCVATSVAELPHVCGSVLSQGFFTLPLLRMPGSRFIQKLSRPFGNGHRHCT